MASGRSIQLTKQVGEYLVASELARRGLMVATFSGNVPDFDIIATDFKGRSCPIQVKTIKGGDWQFSIDKFSEISFEGKKQILGKKKSLPIPDLVCVFVIAAEKYGEDQFFVVKWSRVRDIIIKHYKYWLDIHGGNRPRKFDSLHCAISEKNLLKYRDNWELIINRF
ncbi:MAG: hypothetical protein JXR49_22265 [Acidobacteria bacterium]|nr:hypothetical protein [Acidobacteriota bacterium]